MKTEWQPEQLQKSADMAAKVAKSTGNRPALACIVIRADGDEVTATASDGEHEITIVCSATIHKPGIVAVDAARLASIARQCPGPVIMSATKSGVSITSGGFRWSLQTIDPDTCPAPTHLDGDEQRIVAGSQGRSAAVIGSLVAFADVDASRYALNGVLIDGEHCVATDGRRLTIRQVPGAVAGSGSGVLGSGSRIVPSKLASLAGRMFGADGTLEIYADANRITFHGLEAKLTGRLVEGRFPRWIDVIPKPDGYGSAGANVGELTAALKGCRVTTSESSRGVDMTFTAGGGVELSTASEAGNCVGSCSLMNSTIGSFVASNGDAKISIDPQYLLDLLSLFPIEEWATIRVKDRAAAMVVECQDVRGVIMPMSKE